MRYLTYGTKDLLTFKSTLAASWTVAAAMFFWLAKLFEGFSEVDTGLLYLVSLMACGAGFFIVCLEVIYYFIDEERL